MYGTPGGIVEMFGGLVAYWCLAMVGWAFSYRGEGEALGKNCAAVAAGDGVAADAVWSWPA